MVELKKEVEALLFSSGRRMDIEEISRLCKSKPEEVGNILEELKKTYEDTTSSLMLVNEGSFWKLTVREKYLQLVQNIVTQTELSKTLMETLAVIAFKYPIKQADLIKIRTNKAYDHLKELEEMGYITRQKHGRTKLIKLTQKFFDYFDLPPDKLKEKFETFEGIAKVIVEKETEIKKMKEERKKELEKSKKKEEEIKQAIEKEGPEIDLIDEKGHKEKLEVYEEQKEKPKTQIIEEKLGKLDVVDEPESEETEIEEPEETTEEERSEEKPAEEEEKVQELVKDILTEDEEKEKPAEEKSEVDKKVEEMLTGKREEEPTETDETSEEPKEEPQNILEAAQEEKKEPKKEKTEEQKE